MRDSWDVQSAKSSAVGLRHFVIVPKDTGSDLRNIAIACTDNTKTAYRRSLHVHAIPAGKAFGQHPLPAVLRKHAQPQRSRLN